MSLPPHTETGTDAVISMLPARQAARSPLADPTVIALRERVDDALAAALDSGVSPQVGAYLAELEIALDAMFDAIIAQGRTATFPRLCGRLVRFPIVGEIKD